MPPSARSMKKRHQHFFSNQRSESVSQHVFTTLILSWLAVWSLFCSRPMSPVSLQRARRPNDTLARWATAGHCLSRFTARPNASRLLKYALAEAGWPDKKSWQYCGWAFKYEREKKKKRLKQSGDVWRSRSLPREFGMTGFQMKTHHLQWLHLHAARRWMARSPAAAAQCYLHRIKI